MRRNLAFMTGCLRSMVADICCRRPAEDLEEADIRRTQAANFGMRPAGSFATPVKASTERGAEVEMRSLSAVGGPTEADSEVDKGSMSTVSLGSRRSTSLADPAVVPETDSFTSNPLRVVVQ